MIVYAELAPRGSHRDWLDHLFILVDDGRLTAAGRHCFARPFSELRYRWDGAGESSAPQWRASFSAPSDRARPRRRPVVGAIVGLRCRVSPGGLALPPLPWRGAIDAPADLCGVVRALDAVAEALEPRLASLEPVLRGRMVDHRAGAGAGAGADADADGGADGGAVARMARQAGWSERTLRRRFVAMTGVGPKRWSDLHRFRGALLALAEASPDLLDTALTHGYADQPHLNADFRRRAGTSPLRFARRARGERRGDLGRFFQDPAVRSRVQLLLSIPEEQHDDVATDRAAGSELPRAGRGEL